MSPEAAPPEESNGAAGEPERVHDPRVIEAMHLRFALVTKARDATIEGDVGRAAAAGRELATGLAASEPPPAWRPQVEHIRAHADALAGADSLEVAARQVARLAVACGECHAAFDAEPRMLPLPEPLERVPPSDLEAVMKWHAWSTDRMWEGLIAPSAERWIRGTTMFAELPGCADLVGSRARELPACEHNLALTRQAHIASDDEARREVYGRLLAGCADCHAAAREP